MGEGLVAERISAWEKAGLIDRETAERLRRAEAGTGLPSQQPAGPPEARPERPADVGPASGAVIIPELFTYLGALFVLLAWHAALLADTSPSPGHSRELLMTAVPAVALSAVGFLLVRQPGGRPGRAGGVAWLVATWYVVSAVYFGTQWLGLPDEEPEVLLSTACGLAAAAVYRRSYPALATQLALVIGIVYTAWAAMAWLGAALFPWHPGPYNDYMAPTGAAAMARVVLTAVGWWLTAGALGLIAHLVTADARPGADGRRALSRLAVGFTAVFGTTSAIAMTEPVADTWTWQRVLPPVLGDLLLIVVCAVLVLVGGRLRSTTYLWPAALGIVVALTDLNASYVAGSNLSTALFGEGLILFGVAMATWWIRRRMVSPARETAS